MPDSKYVTEENCGNLKSESSSKPRVFHKRTFSESNLRIVNLGLKNAIPCQDYIAPSKNLVINSFKTKKKSSFITNTLKTDQCKSP